jgi:hypothetical protein
MTTTEVARFVRKVPLQLKPNSVAEFTRTIENDIIPSAKPRTDIEKFPLVRG